MIKYLKTKHSKCNLRTFLTILLTILSITLLMTCTKKDLHSKDLNFTATPLFNAYINYVVINEDYTRIFTKKNKQSEVHGIARRGDIFILIDTSGEDERSYGWYQIQNNKVEGWVLTINPYLVYSLDQAQLLQKQLLEDLD